MENTIYNSNKIQNLEKTFRVNFVNSLSGFKSINLCGSISEDKTENLAIFNSVIHVGSEPPLMGLLVRPPVIPRDTLNNIRSSGYFSLNHILEDFYFKAHQTAAKYNSDKSEFEAVGLKAEYSDALPAPYVKESAIKIGLRLAEEHTIESNGTIFLVGEIIETIVPSRCLLSDGLIDLAMAGTITTSGLDTYYRTQKIARLSAANPGKELNKIG